ncbi:hypothetical protein GB937_006274 [Aspergillus fischeri]|nr:hypothetical protein GB937_006274 [Aspergillus fischeri]
MKLKDISYRCDDAKALGFGMELEVKANTLVASERLSYHLRYHVITAWQIDNSGGSSQPA